MPFDLDALVRAAAFIVGSAVGSFLNVVIYRLPREESIISPPSRCPNCQAPIRWYHNVPILGWLILWGRCRTCKAPISWRYPFVELLTALLALSIVLRYGLSFSAAFMFVFGAALLAVTFIDLDHLIIPNEISLSGIVVGLLGQMAFDLAAWPSPANLTTLQAWFVHGRFLWALTAALLGGGGFWLLAEIFYRFRGIEGLGGGDVKLLAMIGAFTSPLGVLQTVLIGSSIGSVIGIAYILGSRKGAQARIPFGPFLAIGALSVVFWPDLVSGFLEDALLP